MGSALVQIIACHLFGAKPLSEPNAGLLSIGPLGTNFSEILIKLQNFSFTKIRLKTLSAKWWPFCPGGDELTRWSLNRMTNILPMTFQPHFPEIITKQFQYNLAVNCSVERHSTKFPIFSCGSMFMLLQTPGSATVDLKYLSLVTYDGKSLWMIAVSGS